MPRVLFLLRLPCIIVLIQFATPNLGSTFFYNASAIYSGFDAADLARAKEQRALCARNGTVVHVGSHEPTLAACRGVNVTRVDLHRRVVFPGFIDAHSHLLFGGTDVDFCCKTVEFMFQISGFSIP